MLGCKVNCSAALAVCPVARWGSLNISRKISSALVAPLAPAVEPVLCAQPLAPPAGRLVRARVRARVRVRVRVKG